MLKTQPNITTPADQESISLKFDQAREYLYEGNYLQAKEILLTLHPADLADFIDNASSEETEVILDVIQKEINPETLVMMSTKSKLAATEIYPVKTLSKLLAELSAEDALEFISEISLDVKEQIIAHLPKKKRGEILEGFNYPEYSAGRVMSRRFVYFYSNWTVKEAVETMRNVLKDFKEEFHAAVVVDSKNKPVGTLALSSLLKSAENVKIEDIMHSEFKIASTETELEDLSYIFKHYALTLVPVVNKAGKLVGTISIDNMVYIIDEQAEDAILNLGGLNEIDIYDTFVTAAKHRFPWLFINLISAYITSLIINNFENIIAQMVTLAAIMPIVASMGGNAATQTMTVTIMAISNKDIDKINNLKIILKELLTCGFNGAVLAILGALIIVGLFEDVMLAEVFAMAVLFIFILGGIIGSAVPIILDKFNMDPAVSSGVIISGLTDALGFFLFLGLAKILIQF